MSELIWCSITIKYPATWGEDPWFVESLFNALTDGWSTPDRSAGEGFMTVEVTGDGNYGLADDDVEVVLEWLRTHCVPYVATSDAKYEIPGEIVCFDGWTARGAEAGPSGAVLSAREYGRIISGKHEWARSVEAFFALNDFDVAACGIPHLPATCPPPDDKDDA